MKRRDLLCALATLPLWHALGAHAATALSPAAPGSRPTRMVVVFLRGAVDGLSVVVPWKDEAYHEARPGIALSGPDEPDGVIALDDRFGLAPALRGLYPFWQRRQLAFVHASGLLNPTRSHFEAQALIERGLTVASKGGAETGWLNRVLAALPADGVEHGVAVGDVVPLMLRGDRPVASLTPSVQASTPAEATGLLAALGPLYDPADEVGRVFHAARASRARLQADLAREGEMAANGAPALDSFGRDAEKLGTLMRAAPGMRLAMMAAGGWDTHINQGAADGALARKLGRLSDGLQRLAAALGPVYEETVIVVMSEFGRTLRENGTGGTDHGHGNTMWLLGGAVRGGRVYADWPGLQPAGLNEGRDLRITTDYRQVLSELLVGHLRLDRRHLAGVFPGFRPGASLGVIG